MKIAQCIQNGRVRLGLVQSREVSLLDFEGDMLDFITGGYGPVVSGERLPLGELTLQAPLSRPSKIIAIGLNYQDHAEESKGHLPENPLIFSKFTNSIIGHREKIRWNPKLARKVDYEAELAVIIGKKTRACHERDALAAVFGYTCANDVSARDLQFGDKQWVRGKSLDTFCPLGPWIVTADEVPDPQKLGIQCHLNGRLMQDSHTSGMIFPVAFLISFISKYFTLIPGDIILTGTPSGVGAFRDPPVYLQHDDRLVVG